MTNAPRNGKRTIVMVVSRNYAPDVQMIRVRRQAQALVERGYRVTVLCWSRRKGFSKHEKADEGFDIIRIFVPSDYGKFVLYLLTLPLFQFMAFIHLVKNRYDVLSAHDFDTLFPSVLASKFTRLPLVYDVHDIFFYHPGLNSVPMGTGLGRVIKWIESKLLKSCNNVIVPGDRWLEVYKEMHAPNLTVVLTSPSLNFVPKDKVSRFPKGQFKISYIGTVREIDGFLALIRAAKRVNDNLNIRMVHIEIIGGGSTSITFDRLKDLTHNSNVNVTFRGWVPYTALPDIYINTSLVYCMYDPKDINGSNATGIKFMEAMAAGKPVLTTKGSVMGEMTERWGIGYALPYADEKAIALAIEDAIKNKEKFRKMGLRAREVFENEFAWEVMIERLERIYSMEKA